MEVPGMVVTPNTIPFPSPTIDAAEARRAADELAGLIARVGPDSVAGLVLRNAERELRSLIPDGAAAAAGEVVGPFRVRAAA
jgi:hypothetical protein